MEGLPRLGTAAGEAALALCANPDVKAVKGTAPFTTPGGNDVTSILLKPQPITTDNLDVVLDAGWIDKASLCQGVTGSGRGLRLTGVGSSAPVGRQGQVRTMSVRPVCR